MLHEYGIQSENSTHRLHIDIYNNMAFVFPTADGVNALPEPIIPKLDSDWTTSGYYIVCPDWAKGQPTARGIRIKHEDIKNCKAIEMPVEISGNRNIDKESTSTKGRIAETLGEILIKEGLVPFQMETLYVDTKEGQISGMDIECKPIKIEIKFDGGCYKRGLFLQTHERNIYGDF